MIMLESNPSQNILMNPKSKNSKQLQFKSQLNKQSQNQSKSHKFIRSNNKQKHLQTIQSPQKKSLPIKQFQYGQVFAKLTKRTHSQSRFRASAQINFMQQNLKLDRIPIQIVKDKIQFQENTKINLFKLATSDNILIRNDSEYSPWQNPQTYTDENNHRNTQWISTAPNFHKMTAKELCQMKQRTFKPKLSMFEKFNYQNYENYNYKNPFKSHKNNSLSKKSSSNNRYQFPKNNKYQINKGSSKNLQIVFCESKYPQFVKKTNQIYQKQRQIKTYQQKTLSIQSRNNIWNVQENRSQENNLKLLKKNIIEKLNINSRQLLNSKNAARWTYCSSKSELSPKQQFNKKKFKTSLLLNKKTNLKSTLQKHLQQFKVLEQLTLLHEKQQQTSHLRKKQTPNAIEDISKTVLINLLISKLPFLQNLNISFRNHMLKSLFELNQINEFSKISIHDYLKLNRIFIQMDSPPMEISVFIFSLLFKNSSKPSFESEKKVINLLNPKNRQKLQISIQMLFEYCNQTELCYESIIQKFIQNQHWVLLIINLIKDQ